ncbi:hydrogenase maturation protease [Methanolobus sp. ZRKC3]|uniref:hydrogenase maturation protease n=1 Tax=Methanolobus sp. ZRKC3 TaxID=3125786 RepID=UPI00324D9732
MLKKKLRSDPTIRILGCGNPLIGDDGIGIHVIERLKEMHDKLPDDVELVDAGVCGLDMLNLLEDVSRVIIVDAIKGAGDAGSVHRFSAEDIKAASSANAFSMHDTSLADVLCISEHIQKMPEQITVFGIEIGKADEISLSLSDKVQDSVDEIIELILDEISIMKAFELYGGDSSDCHQMLLPS